MKSQTRVSALRQTEISKNIRISCLKSINFTTLYYAGFFASAVIFYINSAQHTKLQPGPTFAALSCYFYISLFTAFCVGTAIQSISQFRSILRRISEILLLQEKQGSKESPNLTSDIKGVSIRFTEASISWGESLRRRETTGLSSQSLTIKPKKKKLNKYSKVEPVPLSQRNASPDIVLEHVNLEIKKGEFVAVIGEVCSGKTTLLHSIMKENFLVGQGSVWHHPRATMSYVEQEPFIMSDTLRNNILFGLNYSHQRFRTILEMACLTEDLDLLVNGQFTQIGQRGINLSGGQRARVSLARALYADTNIYLLDDPLSAVDPRVGNLLLKKALLQFLAGRTRVLVTHQLSVLPYVDRVILLRNGQVAFNGSFVELQSSEQHLLSFLKFQPEAISPEDKLSIEEDELNSSHKEPPKKANDYKRKASSGMSLIQAQEKEKQGMSCRLFCEFLKLSCGVCTFPLFVILLIPAQFFHLFVSIWLRHWVSQPASEQFDPMYRSVLLLLVLLLIFSAFLQIFFSGLLFQVQGKKLHFKMLQRIVRAKYIFFSSNPVGRILNRFSKDISIIDNNLSFFFPWVMIQLARVLVIFCFVCLFNPWLILFVGLIGFLCLYLRGRILKITREAMRLDLTSRSPITTILSQSLGGLATIRAYSRVSHFQREFEDSVDKNAKAMFTYWVLNRHFGFSLDLLSSVFIIATILLAFLVRTQDNFLFLIITIQLVGELMGVLQGTVRMSSDVINHMTSVSRCSQYSKLPTEAALQS